MNKFNENHLSLDAKLKEQGFNIEFLVPNNDLETMMKFVINQAKKYYRDYQIVPGEVAFEGKGLIPEEPFHLIYIIRNKAHPHWRDPIQKEKIMANFIDKKTGNVIYTEL